MADEYEQSAEFIDVMIAPSWEATSPALAEALRGVSGPIVDVGAGGGHGTRLIAATVADAEILAVEPSPGLRSVLLARVNESAELRDRVTVLPEGLLEAELPDRLGAVVAMSVIGHFDPAGRRQIWALLAERLLPGGRAVLNLLPPTQAMAVPDSRFADVRLGRRRYEGWGRAEPAGPDRLTWHMTYRTYHDDRLVGEVQVDYDWWVLDGQRLKEELSEHGLVASHTGPEELGMYVIDRGGA
ncbi:class I SAM-dependent methyltransferase [Nonomuraea turcica]|uniref:class I SAM-dependent methyltransferase n=1 Tax=Nonomuraea sp. G32 TaxID=3067274 RepID=UPI00273B66B7|nr:class I SAM-dependent methyltransferase [Nonomuraea sp. G32]MDP4511315.1 class I SAM-dependent methyltransferase [Nonomuraea sp. G32]